MIWHHSESFLLLLLTILTNHKSLLQESDCTGSDTGIMDAIIDVKVALTKGMVSLAPFHTDTVEECHDECCSDLPVTGEHLCNFITFNPRKKSSYQNCYLFYCPDKDACPLMESKGYISHFIHRELKNIRDESTEETYFHRGEESSDDGIAPDLLNKLTFNPTQITSHQSPTVPTLQATTVQPKTSSIHTKVYSFPVTIKRLMAATPLLTTLSLTTDKPKTMTIHPTTQSTATSASLTNLSMTTTQRTRINHQTALSNATMQPTTTTTFSVRLRVPTTIPVPTTQTAAITTTVTLPTTVPVPTTQTAAITTTVPLPTTVPVPTTQTAPITTTVPLPTTVPVPTTQTAPITTTVPLPTTVPVPTTQTAPITTTIPLPTTVPAPTTQTVPITTTVPLPTTVPVPTTQTAPIITTVPVPTTITVPTTQTAPITTTIPVPTTVPVPTTQTVPITTTVPLPTTITVPTTVPVPTTQTTTTTLLTTTIHLTTTTAPTTKLAPKMTQQSTPSKIPVAKTPLNGIVTVVSSKGRNGALGSHVDSAGKTEDSKVEVQSGLIAALLFGLLFLIIVVFVISKRITESYNRRHYTKIDYLINGMYVDA